MDVKLLVDEIESFASSKLNHKETLLMLFKCVEMSGRDELIEQTSFTAKYVRGLMRVLRDGSKNPEVKSLEHVKHDLTENMKKITLQLREIISDAPEAERTDFEKQYLGLNAESFSNLNSLLADLEWTKIYLNEMKRAKR